MSDSPTTIDWPQELVEQLDWHWRTFTRPHLESLTDDEYRWEPVPGMWSIRRRGESSAPIQAGGGEGVMEFANPEPRVPPATTIAWRLGHLCEVFGARAASHFGAPPLTYEDTDWPLGAADGLTLLDRCYDAWNSGVRALDEAALARPCGPTEGPYAEFPFAALILHINREGLHHGAEILLLRDLYRARNLNGALR